jgi:hypothetical protein
VLVELDQGEGDRRERESGRRQPFIGIGGTSALCWHNGVGSIELRGETDDGFARGETSSACGDAGSVGCCLRGGDERNCER